MTIQELVIYERAEMIRISAYDTAIFETSLFTTEQFNQEYIDTQFAWNDVTCQEWTDD